MKTKFKKLMSILLSQAILLTTSGISVIALDAEPVPETLDAPSIILYDNGYSTMNLEVKAQTPESVIDFYEKAYTNSYTDDNYNTFSDYGEWFGSYGSGIQVDYRIDEGEWQYTSEWDTSLYDCETYGSFSGHYISAVTLGSASSYYNYGIGEVLSNEGYLIETTDGSSTYYRFDTENHKISVRARYYIRLQNNEYENKVILSDWSDTAVYGQGSIAESSAPLSLNAPVIANGEIYDTDSSYQTPQVCFDVFPDASVTDTMLWSEQYNTQMTDSTLRLIIEASLDPDFGAGSTVISTTISENSSLKRRQYYDDMFYDLWYELPSSDQKAFVWNGETLYFRVKYEHEREVSDSWSTIESPYSNVLSIEGPVIGKYDITITHEPYGFDTEGYYSESYSRTEGRELSSVYCAPLEGCYVDTVTVNDVVMYNKEDESTYELLDWWSDYESFDFIGDDRYAAKNLDIVITYAGTPTAKYGIATECGSGGYLYTDAYYDSWDDNSLVVFHGAAPTITIHPNNGFEIDTVLIDGVENSEAQENCEYTFPPITDSTHSIEVTFKRVAYPVYSYVYHGTISTDYEGYEESAEYVTIGDDITFTFAPAQDENGNYYEIEKVYIDWVLNEEAKNTGTYTFENVQAEHSIDVYYSEDPVITHDITATSGENGSISPEGIIHAREGSTRTFYFYPDDGYEVDKVYVDGVEITNLATTEYYNIADITEAHTIHVTFKKLPVQYDVNVIVSGHNTDVHTVNPKGVTPVWENESFTVTYSPFAGYEVEKVLVNGTEVEANGTYEITSVNTDYSIEIIFRIMSYTVTFVDYDGTILKTEIVEHGKQATAPADPQREHYVFTGWDTTYSDITTNVTIRAMYEPAQYTVTFVSWDGQVLKTETVAYTESATAPDAPAREGYDFSHWSHDYTNVSSNLEVTAVYTPKEYTVQFVDWDDTVLSVQTIKYGEGATPPMAPVKEGYTFVGWDNTNYSYVTQDMIIKAMYVEGVGVVYSITANAYGNSGSVSPSGVTEIVENGSVTVHFYPNELSKILKVIVDGNEIDVCNSYTFENVTADHTVDVYFAPTAVININNDEIEHGTVDGHYELLDGTMVYVLELTPTEGYEVDGVYINGELITLEMIDGNYIIRDLSEDMDIDVYFTTVSDELTTTTTTTTNITTTTTSADSSVTGTTTIDINKTEAPKTGDNMNFTLMFILLSISGVVLILSGRRKKSNYASMR